MHDESLISDGVRCRRRDSARRLDEQIQGMFAEDVGVAERSGVAWYAYSGRDNKGGVRPRGQRSGSDGWGVVGTVPCMSLVRAHRPFPWPPP
ncbi:hypothetical protein GCM10020001_043110 [Nonomuraea salmonea]